jgi:arginine-tRNA-protein transferase
MEFCREKQLQYFYPGYVVPGCAPFDYKLEVGKASLEYLQLSTLQWVPFLTKEALVNPLQQMVEKLRLLQLYLAVNNIPNQFLHYRFFEANLHPYYYGYDLFDFPVFLNCFPLDEASSYSVIVYDVRTGRYHLLNCSAVVNIGFQMESSNIFDADLLKVKAWKFASSTPEDMATYMEQLEK